MRDLKTTPVGVLTYPAYRTKNMLTAEAKDRDHYTKRNDKYLHFREKLKLGTGTIADLKELDVEKVLQEAAKIKDDPKIKDEAEEYNSSDWRTDCELISLIRCCSCSHS
jgi:hypothetical protein